MSMDSSKLFLNSINIGSVKLGTSDVILYLGEELIYPLSSDFTITYDAATYNGLLQIAQNIVVIDNSGNTLVENVDYVVTENNGGINAGYYPIKITLMGQYQGTTRTRFIISKVTPTVTAPTAKALTYNGSSQTLANAGSTNWGILEYSVDGTNYSTDIPSGITAGSYTVYYKVEGDSNINDVAAQSISCYIDKVTPTVTAPTAKSVTYNGNSQALVNAGSTNYGTLKYSSNGTNYSTDVPSGITGGSYTVYHKVEGDSNINDVAAQSIACYINKADSSLSFAVTDIIIEVGETKTNIATVNAGDGTVTYASSNPSAVTVDNSGNVTGIDSGNAIISANISSTSNYNSATTSYNANCPLILRAKFNATSTSSPTRIASDTANFCKVKIDGVERPSVTTGYTFSTTGEHVVDYYLIDNTYIGLESFLNCANLTSIEIPNGITSISSSVFRGCSGLTRLNSDVDGVFNIPNSVIFIRNFAFTDCHSLSSCTLGSGVISIGQSAFRGCSGLTSINIPDSVEDIGSSAFRDCSGLTSIDIPSGVTFIGGYAFWNCVNLENLDIPDGVTSIGEYTFANCSGMTSCTISSGVTSIGNFAFWGCASLTSLTIPSGVTSIGVAAFEDCKSLTSVNIPDSVKAINGRTFSNCRSLTNIDIPSGVTSIGGRAFMHCISLTSLTIPSGVTSIGDETFYNCGSLTSINIPSGVTSIGYSAFAYCNRLTNINIPSGVTSIGERTFQGCSGLTNIEIPDSVTSIGGGAFGYCTGLTSCAIGSGVTNIGQSAFERCSGLTSVTIPDSVTSIGEYAFIRCIRIISLHIPSGVTTIGYAAFESCSGLTSITVSNENTVYDSRNNCNAIIETSTNTLICGCKYTTIPNTVTNIGDLAFYECKDLTSIVIPDSVTSIGERAFSRCYSLSSCTIGSGVTVINNDAFHDCSGLTSVDIPDKVVYIGINAFIACYNLTNLTIGTGLTTIGRDAFRLCYKLGSITCNVTTAPTIQSTTFQDVKTGGTLTVPSGSSGYDVWMGTGDYYLGKYNWTKVEQ